MFLSHNYTPGDRIILLVSSSRKIPHYPMKAAEALARHLHEEIEPDALEEIMFPGESRMEASKPIHCVGIHARGQIDSVSGWNEELKLRFPSGIKRIVCWNTSNVTHQTCVATFDQDGSTLSKEVN
ncbi:unnamed protein product [Rhizoctonia solani]|uniref:Uncharacterized protein n=1 Tax=Rhizoctonia solani TaxID=456999 RepID=A0A8H2XHH6_9AGAM|nr:unnamed protein product [Rhizoctonia solani]